MRRPHREARAVRALVERTTQVVESSGPSGSRSPDVPTPIEADHRPQGRRILAIAAAVTAICVGLGAYRLTSDRSSTVISKPSQESERGSIDHPLDEAHTSTSGMTVDAELVRTVLATDDLSPVECHEPTIVSVTARADDEMFRGGDELPVPQRDQIAVARVRMVPSTGDGPVDVNRPPHLVPHDVVLLDEPTMIAARGAGIVRLVLRSDDGTTEAARPTKSSDFTVVALRASRKLNPAGIEEVTLAPSTLTIETTLGPPIVVDLHNSLLDLPLAASQPRVPTGGVPSDHLDADHVVLDVEGRRHITPAEEARFSGRCVDDVTNLHPSTSVPPPSDHASADIVTAIDSVLDGSRPIDERAAFTDDPDRFRRLATDSRVESLLSTPRRFEPTAITFTDDRTAVAVGTVLGVEITGRAVRSGDRWLITWQSICTSPLSFADACVDAPKPGTYPSELRRVVPLPP